MEPGGETSAMLTPASLGIGGEPTVAITPAGIGMALEPAAVAGDAADPGAGRISPGERLLDLTLTIIALPVILLIGTAIAIAIYIDSPGPVMFRSWRVGRGGVPFAMLKFRKMRDDAGSGPLTVDNDDRFTPIGRFLAVTRLDELPQVWNVLRGEMRLVGPRPEVQYFVAEFEEQYAEILTVTPGITGDSQLRFVDEKSLLGGSDPATTYREQVLPEKLKIDLSYVRSRSLAGDLAILARTVALPFMLAFDKLRSRSSVLRVWLPTAASAALLVLVFVVTSSHLS